MNEHLDSPIVIESSILNWFDKSILHTGFWPVHAFVDTIRQAGYNGLQVHPLRGIVAGLQLNSGRLSEDSKSAITSLHQSYRGEKNLNEALHHQNPVLATFSWALLTEMFQSLDAMERLQRTVGRQLPAVLYPPIHRSAEAGTERSFAEKLFQPTPEIMSNWNVQTVDELIAEAKRRGYTGFALDLFHMRAQSENNKSLHPWQETLPKLLPFVKEIHVAAGRFDIKQQDIDTEQELKDLVDVRGPTDIIKMLKMIRELNWSGRIVTETPAMSLQSIREKTIMTPIEALVFEHHRIVKTIQAIMS